MGKIKFKNNKVEDFTLVLSTRSLQHLGQLSGIKNIKFNANLNSAQTLSFAVYKNDLISQQTKMWDNLVDFKLIWVKELNEYFEICVSLDDANDTIKNVTGTSLCEAELSQTIIYNTQINSESDISRDDYKVTTFYNTEDTESSMLHRVLSKAPHYRIKHVDKSLCDLQRTFSIDGTSIYDFLVGECSEQFDCLFQFDSYDRSISAYDLNTFGKDTTIYVDKDNLTDSIHVETAGDSVKNCFKLEGGDDVMNAAIRNLNPNGSDYLYVLRDDDKKDMPVELVDKLDSYDLFYDSFKEEYQSITEQCYDLTDQILYYESGMMPTIENAEVTASSEAEKLTYNNLSIIALENVTSSTSPATVNSALKNYAKVFIKTGYVKLEIEEDEPFKYIGIDEKGWHYGTWSGRFKVTNYSDEKDIAYSDTLTITVNNNYETFVTQQVQKNIKSSDGDDENSVFDVLSIDKLDEFKEAITLYSLNRLLSFSDAIQGALNMLIQLDHASEGAELYGTLYQPYHNKLIACQDEMNIRQKTIDDLQHELDSLTERRTEIQSELNFENYLGILYPIFCAYRREDKFSNSNYISDGLDNAQLLKRAEEFWELAEKELIKSSEGTITLSSTLYNLLALKEFQPIVDYFELGNRIRVRADGKLFQVRLIGYEIDFDNLQTITVTFSNVTKLKNLKTETDSIIQSAKSMATTYSTITKQAVKGQEASQNIHSVLQNGLNSAVVQIKNNDHEEITYGKHGILCRNYDDIENSYDAKQLKLTHNTIAFTDDNWKSVKTAIGEHDFRTYNVDKNQWETLTDYGMTAQFVTAGVIIGENKIVGGLICSKNYSDGKTKDEDGNILEKDGSIINLETGVFSFAGGGLTYDGTNLSISDTAIGESLQGIEITADKLRINAENIIGTFKNDININDKFVVDRDGNITKITLPASATLPWGQITNSPDILSETEISEIVNETVTSDYINTLNITAKNVAEGATIVNAKSIGTENLYMMTPHIFDVDNDTYKTGVTGTYTIGSHVLTIIGGIIVDIQEKQEEQITEEVTF